MTCFSTTELFTTEPHGFRTTELLTTEPHGFRTTELLTTEPHGFRTTFQVYGNVPSLFIKVSFLTLIAGANIDLMLTDQQCVFLWYGLSFDLCCLVA